jgi:hypothetical protein
MMMPNTLNVLATGLAMKIVYGGLCACSQLCAQALRAAVAMYGEHRWVEVARHVPGRMPVQCRERYVKSLRDNRVRGLWYPDEDEVLVRAVARMGTGMVCEHMRTHGIYRQLGGHIHALLAAPQQ